VGAKVRSLRGWWPRVTHGMNGEITKVRYEPTYVSFHSHSAFSLRAFIYWSIRRPTEAAGVLCEGVGRFTVMLQAQPVAKPSTEYEVEGEKIVV